MTLPDIFDISTVQAQHALLLTAFANAGAITIDASRVARADAAAMQLLTAAAVEARQQARGLEVLNPSPAFTTVARTLGLEAVLGLGH